MVNSAFSPRFGGASSRISPWVALPLLPICPVAAGAVALAATLRNRAWLGTAGGHVNPYSCGVTWFNDNMISGAISETFSSYNSLTIKKSG